MEPLPAARGLPPLRRLGDPPVAQFGMVEAVLAWQQLVAAVSRPLTEVAAALGLVAEESFSRDRRCSLTYMQTEDDGFTLVQWEGSPDVEVYAYVEGTDGDFRGRDELRRFLAVTRLSGSDLHFPANFA